MKWSDTDYDLEHVKEELADVLNYCILMADVCGLDMDEIIQEKIKKNNAKYPVDKAKNSAKKYDEL
jgi:NTP pyrophosphatase (non-canonical NTP hydrolase)